MRKGDKSVFYLEFFTNIVSKLSKFKKLVLDRCFGYIKSKNLQLKGLKVVTTVDKVLCIPHSVD